jgi:hypothetical protein
MEGLRTHYASQDSYNPLILLPLSCLSSKCNQRNNREANSLK